MKESANKTKSNLFASAKKVDKKKETKSNNPVLPVPPELEEAIKEYIKAKEELKTWETKKDISEATIKETGRRLFLEQYRKNGRNIGSFKLGPVTISVQDRYTKMSEEVAVMVAANFPDVIETETVYVFNQEILKKYIDEISEALQSAEGIPEEDLQQLIEVSEVTSVKKGTIDTLATYGEQMEDVFQAISPIISMR